MPTAAAVLQAHRLHHHPWRGAGRSSLPLCIGPAVGREEAKRAAQILRADLDRFFGELFACSVLQRRLQHEVEEPHQWLEEEGYRRRVVKSSRVPKLLTARVCTSLRRKRGGGSSSSG